MNNFWLLTTEFPPQSGGGISTYCIQTVNMFYSKGIQSKVFVPSYNHNEITREKYDWGELIYSPVNHPEYKNTLGYEALSSFTIAETVYKELEKSSSIPDVIETQDYLGLGYYLLQNKWNLTHPLLTDIPIVLTLHAPDFLYQEFNQGPRYKFPTYWVGEMEKWAINAADIVISPSQFLVDELKKRIDFSSIDAKVLFNPYEEDITPSVTDFKQNDIVFFWKIDPTKRSNRNVRLF